MSQRASAERLRRLQASLARRLGILDIELAAFREGADCWVDRVNRPQKPPAVVRSAKAERILTRYEGLVDFGAEIEKQIVASRLLRENGVPTPAVLAWHRTADPQDEPSWILLEWVDHDAASWTDETLQHELGMIARRIHAIEPPTEVLAAFPPSSPWSPWIADRILMRVAAAGNYIAVSDLPALRRAVLAATQPRGAHARSLLHLDLRPPNLAVRDGRIVSVFDLANAIIGDPWLELARVRGCGLLSTAFLRGYGADLGECRSFQAALDVYELDLAALLVVVSREEFDDPSLHSVMSRRTLALMDRVMTGGPS